MRLRLSQAAFVAFLFASVVALPAPAFADLPQQAAEALALAKAGKPQEAYQKVLEALERASDDVQVLTLASSYAHDAGHDDEALWYARLALERVEPGKDAAKQTESLTKLVAVLDPTVVAPAKGAPAAPSPIDAWASALFDLAKSCAGRKLWVNAVDLLSRLEDTSIGDKATAELAKIYANKQAVAVLLDSGLPVPLKSKRDRKSPEAIAREDAKHATWDARRKYKGDNYTLETDMSSVTAEAMSAAMEQMNKFYRKVFHVKERGGDTARVTIKLYRSRAEFDEHEGAEKPISPMVRGFFSPSELKVATYDHRTDGLGLGFTWSTLFHESSHQFTHLISADLVPAWLNEGTASYFEGARLLVNGTIETNLVPEGRLKALAKSLDAIETSSLGGQPSLKDVVSFYQPGSYPGEYYPYGWGLVYFLQNYEDESANRPYVQIYQDYIASYKTGGKHDPFQRFCDFFVVRAKQPGIETFEQFEAAWRKWIRGLHTTYFGPPSTADLLVTRARRQRDAKQTDNAIETYRWALGKRPGDVVANLELGDLFAAEKDKDRALYHWRAARVGLASLADEHAAIAGSSEDAAALSATLEGKLTTLDKDFTAALEGARAKFAPAVEERAKLYVEKGRARTALAVLDLADELDGASAAREALRESIRSEASVDLERWRRLPLAADLAGFEASPAFHVADGALVGKSQGLAACEWSGALAPHYRFEVRIANAAKNGVWGVQYSSSANGTYLLGWFPDGHAQLLKLAEQQEDLGVLAPISPAQLGDFVLAVERHEDRFDFYVDGKKVGSRPASGDELSGGIGVFQQGAEVRFSDLRVLQE
jgi:hypothetical protein